MSFNNVGQSFTSLAEASGAPGYDIAFDADVSGGLAAQQDEYEQRIKNPVYHNNWFKDYAWNGVVGGVERGVRQLLNFAVEVGSEVVATNPTYNMQFNTLSAAATMAGIKVPAITEDGRVEFKAAPIITKDYQYGQNTKEYGLDQSAIADPERTGAKLVQGLSSFIVPFKAASTGMKAAEVFAEWGKAGTIARDVLASASVAFSAIDPAEQNLANTLKEAGVDHTAVAEFTHIDTLVDALAVDKDDTALEARLKSATADAVSNLALTGIVQSARALREMKIVKRSFEVSAEAADIVIPHADSEIGKAAKEFVDQAEGITPVAAEPAAEVTGASTIAKEAADPVATRMAKPKPLTTIDAMLTKMDELESSITDAEINGLVHGIANGTPFEVIERMGLNPARVDLGNWMSGFSNPEEMAASFHDLLERISSSGVGKRIAGAMGSNARSDEAAAFLARMIGSDVGGVIGGLKAKTQNLDLYVRAASSFVAGEAAKLTEYASRLKNMEALGTFTFEDASHPAYIAFTKQLETLTALQSTLRGSFSEMGRSFRAIQQLHAMRTPKAAVEGAANILGEEGAQAAQKLTGKAPKVPTSPKESWDETMRNLGNATTPAQRRALMEQVLKANGDLAQVAQNIAAGEGTLGAKAFRWIRESSANLFSLGTASATSLGMAAYHSLHLISGLVNYPLYALTKNNEYLVGAAINRAKWATLHSAYYNSAIRAVQVAGSSLIKEVGRVGDGAVGSGSEAASELASKFEEALGKVPTLQGDKFGKDVVGRVTNKFRNRDISHEPAIYLSPEDLDTLVKQDNHGPAVFNAAIRHIVGGVVNGYGAATRASRVVTIEFLDELTGSAVFGAHRYAEAVGAGTRNGLELGLSGEALRNHANDFAKRLVSKTSVETSAELQNLVEAGSRDAARIKMLAQDTIVRHGIEEIAEKDARAILFQDQLQTGLGKMAKSAAGRMDPAGIIFPFVHTPLRILETGLMDFSPLGLMKRQLWSDLRSGDHKAAEAMMRIGLGTFALLQGYNMAAAGDLVGYDGGAQSNARLARPQYSMKVGDKWVEYGRIDPLATVIGIGADIYQFERMLEIQGQHVDARAQQSLADLAEVGWLTLQSNILSKTYLQGMKNLAQLADPNTKDAGFWGIVQGLEQRLVPAGGLQKGVASEATDSQLQTTDPASHWEQLKNQWVSSWFFGKDVLWEKRDPFLGQPLEYNRVAGIKVSDHENDGLYKALGDLWFSKMPAVPNSIQGIKLSGDQQHRLLQLLGDTQINGKTLADELKTYVNDPSWEGYNDDQKLAVLKIVRQQYYDNAKAQLLSEDRELFKDVQVTAMTRQLFKSGATPETAKASIEAFRKELDNIQ